MNQRCRTMLCLMIGPALMSGASAASEPRAAAGGDTPAVAATPASSPSHAAKSIFDPWTRPALYELTWRIELDWAEGRGADSPRLWIPLPADNAHQRVRSMTVSAPGPFRIGSDELGNCMVYIEPRSAPGRGGPVEVRCLVERRPVAGAFRPAPTAAAQYDPQRYLAPQRRIPLDGLVRKLARRTTRGCTTTGGRIRAIYDEITHTMRYSKHGRGWGRGDALWACRSKYGNCTDFHSLLIGMCRSEGIPARFVIGFPMPADQAGADVAGYHCWAEVYDADRGWLGLDASEARKSGRFDEYFGRLPADRVELTAGRDLRLVPPQSGPPLNFFVYPYAELGGKPVEHVGWTLHARRRS